MRRLLAVIGVGFALTNFGCGDKFLDATQYTNLPSEDGIIAPAQWTEISGLSPQTLIPYFREHGEPLAWGTR